MVASLAGDRPFSARFRVLLGGDEASRAGQSIRWLSTKGRVVRDLHDCPVRMVGLSIDVTEQQNTLDAARDSRNLAVSGLRFSENRFQTYFNNASECLFDVAVRPDGRLEYEAINPAGLAHAGATLETVHGRTPEEVLGPEAGGIITQALRHVVETGRPYAFEPTLTMRAIRHLRRGLYAALERCGGRHRRSWQRA